MATKNAEAGGLVESVARTSSKEIYGRLDGDFTDEFGGVLCTYPSREGPLA